jgi:hypothetical protein
MNALLNVLRWMTPSMFALGGLGLTLGAMLALASQLPALIQQAALYLAAMSASMPTVAIAQYYAQADTFFPVSEFFIMFSAWVSLRVALVVVRIIKSFVPTIS